MQIPKSLGIATKHPSAVPSLWQLYGNVRSSGSLCPSARVGTNVSSVSEVANGPEALLHKAHKMEEYVIAQKSMLHSEGISEGRGDAAVNNDPWKSTTMMTTTRRDASCYIIPENDHTSQGYSPATISAMARLMGHGNSADTMLAAGQSSIVMIPKAHIMAVLQASAATPLDDASAALGLLCEAGQYETVVQYGTPLLRAAAAAARAPASSTPKVLPGPLGGLGSKSASASSLQSPVPHLDLLIGDLALSLALAHINMAANIDNGGGVSGVAGSGSDSRGLVGDAALEAAYNHLQTAIQVLEQHAGAASRLQQEVAACLQGVAAAYAQEVLRSKHPVAPPLDTPTALSTHYVSGDDSARPPTATVTSTTTATAFTSVGTTTDAMQRRSRALTMLREALWRPPVVDNVSTHTTHPDQHTASSSPSVPKDGFSEGVETTTPMLLFGGINSGGGGGGADGGGGGGGGSGSWVVVQSAEKRQELLAPLRGLMTAAEHIALYGPAASGQKPFYDTVQLSDQELYDLAVAHLAQGVTSVWPHHVLQALSYFERIAQRQQAQQQQQHQKASTNANSISGDSMTTSATTSLGAIQSPTPTSPITPTSTSSSRSPQPTPVDVSFERSVCEALLGRRTTAATPMLYTAAADASPTAMRAGTPSPGGSEPVTSDQGHVGDRSDHEEDDDEAALLRALEAHLAALAGRRPRADVKDGYGEGNDDDEEGGVVYDKEGKDVDDKDVGEGDDLIRRLGWAESWLALSVLPCFPETAAAGAAAGAGEGSGSGGVSLARWFSDPRVILFNKLLEVRTQSPATAAAAIGSTVAHVSYASRQRLWQLWQAAAGAAVAAAAAATRGAAPSSLPASYAAAGGAAAGAFRTAVAAAEGDPDLDANAAATVVKHDSLAPDYPAATSFLTAAAPAAAAPLASWLLSQSRVALQEVAPRAAAAASAMAAAAAAVSSAAANSPQGRAVAAAASRVLPSFGSLPGWIPHGMTSSALTSPPAAANDPDDPNSVPVHVREHADGDADADMVKAGSRGAHSSSSLGWGSSRMTAPVAPAQLVACSRNETHLSESGPQTSNNVVPFPSTTTATTNVVGGSSGGGSGGDDVAIRSLAARSLTATVMSDPEPSSSATPIHLADVSGTTQPAAARSETVVLPESGDTADEEGLLWVSDADGHLRPRMTVRFVHGGAGPHSAATSASVSSIDATESREAIRRVAVVAAQAACLGVLAAYVGHRIVTSGALQRGGGGGSAVMGPADASAAHVASVARAVRKWMGDVGGGRGASASTAGFRGGDNYNSGGGGLPFASLSVASAAQYSNVRSGISPAPYYDTHLHDNKHDSAAARTETSGGKSREELGALAGAATLVRGWVAARALVPALSDPRDRVALLSALSEDKALRQAVAEADGHVLLGRRVELHRLEVTVEHLKILPHSHHAAVSVVQHTAAPTPRPLGSDDVPLAVSAPSPFQGPTDHHHHHRSRQEVPTQMRLRHEHTQDGEKDAGSDGKPLYAQVTAMVESSGTVVDRTAPVASDFVRVERLRLTLCRHREASRGGDTGSLGADCLRTFSQKEVEQFKDGVQKYFQGLHGMETGAGAVAGQGADGAVGTTPDGYRWRIVAASRGQITLPTLYD